MSDVISVSEREAIDAFAQAEVEFVQQGKSGLAPGATGKEWFFNRKGLAPGLRKRSAKRRAEYLQAVEAGLDLDQIAVRLGVTRSGAYQTLRRMKLTARPKGSSS